MLPSRANSFSYEIQDFTLIDLLLKLARSVSIFFNIQIEKFFKIIFSMVLHPNYQHFVSCQSYTKHKYVYIFLQYLNSLADLLMLVYLIIESCMKLKRTKILKDIVH